MTILISFLKYQNTTQLKFTIIDLDNLKGHLFVPIGRDENGTDIFVFETEFI
jgi:hypothetical protein